MNYRFTIQAMFSSRNALDRAMTQLSQECALSKDRMNFISNADIPNNAIKIQRSHKGYFLSRIGVIFGTVLGLIVSLLSTSQIDFDVFLITLPPTINRLLFFVPLFSYFGYWIGFLVGKKLPFYHFGLRSNSDISNRIQYLLFVETTFGEKEAVIKVLQESDATQIDEQDNQQEVELGLRDTEI